jgi:hypothetical protein
MQGDTIGSTIRGDIMGGTFRAHIMGNTGRVTHGQYIQGWVTEL